MKKNSDKDSKTMGDVVLITSYASLFAIRIEWALKLKDVEYELLEEDLWNKSPVLLKHNPWRKKVPVLVVNDDKPIPESLVILDYIEETWKHSPLLPQDPYERAMARFWAKFGDEKCLSAAFRSCWIEGEEKEKAIESAMESFAHIERLIQGKKFFSGDEQQLGYLDLVMGWIPLWLNAMEDVGDMKLLDSEKFPSLYEWSLNFIEMPLIKHSLPPRHKILEHFQRLVSFVRSNKMLMSGWSPVGS